MASNWIIPKRYLRLRLFSGRQELKETKLLSDLNVNTKISFEVTANINGAANDARITITGLTREKMAHLAGTFTNWVNFQVQGEIILDVGYENLHGTVFDGGVFAGMPNLDTENYSITLKCMEAWYDTLQKPISVSFPEGTPLSEIASKIASEGKYIFVNQLEDDLISGAYTRENLTVHQQARALAEAADCQIWIQNGRLYIKNKGQSNKEKAKFTIDVNNMIGVPEPTEIGCRVRIRLNPSIYVGQRVALKSIKFPSINSDDWIVQQITHSGDTKGNKWQTDLLLARGEGYGYLTEQHS